MSAEYDFGYAEGYESGAQDIHKRDARIRTLELAAAHPLSSPNLIARIAALEAVLRRLRNEASSLNAFEVGIREVIGNTIWECLRLRISDADHVLSQADTEGKQP